MHSYIASYIEDIVFGNDTVLFFGGHNGTVYVCRHDNLNCGQLSNQNLSFKQFKTLQLLFCVGYTVLSLPYYVSVKDINKLAVHKPIDFNAINTKSSHK